jgi:hypothetical protein
MTIGEITFMLAVMALTTVVGAAEARAALVPKSACSTSSVHWTFSGTRG